MSTNSGQKRCQSAAGPSRKPATRTSFEPFDMFARPSVTLLRAFLLSHTRPDATIVRCNAVALSGPAAYHRLHWVQDTVRGTEEPTACRLAARSDRENARKRR